MMNERPSALVWIGLVLVLAGAVLPFLIVMKILPSTLFLNFFAFTISVGGLFLGIIGAALYVKKNRKS